MSKPPFEVLVRQHGPTVLRVCRAVLGPVDADDAWSETFLSALAAYPALDERANLQAWLVTVAHRKAIDVTRRRARAPVPVAAPPDRGQVDRTPADPQDELWRALAALPAKQRHAVAYHYLGGMSHREVAGVLGGSEAAARRAAADGIKHLRRALATAGRPPSPALAGAASGASS